MVWKLLFISTTVIVITGYPIPILKPDGTPQGRVAFPGSSILTSFFTASNSMMAAMRNETSNLLNQIKSDLGTRLTQQASTANQVSNATLTALAAFNTNRQKTIAAIVNNTLDSFQNRNTLLTNLMNSTKNSLVNVFNSSSSLISDIVALSLNRTASEANKTAIFAQSFTNQMGIFANLTTAIKQALLDKKGIGNASSSSAATPVPGTPPPGADIGNPGDGIGTQLPGDGNTVPPGAGNTVPPGDGNTAPPANGATIPPGGR